MAGRDVLPFPLAYRRATARRRTVILALGGAVAAALTPVGLVLLPLAASLAWRRGAVRLAVAAAILFAGLAGAAQWIDMRAVAAHPAFLAGPWVALLIGTVVTTAAWAAAGERRTDELLRAAALLTFLCAPWSPCCGALVAATALIVARRLASATPALPVAANDNDRAVPCPLGAFVLRVSYPPPRSARPSARD